MQNLEDKVKAYLGLPPHNGWANYLAWDSYYLESLRKQYGEKAVDNMIKKLGGHRNV